MPGGEALGPPPNPPPASRSLIWNSMTFFDFVCVAVSCCLLYCSLFVVAGGLLLLVILFAMLFVIFLCSIMISFRILFSFATWFLTWCCFCMVVFCCSFLLVCDVMLLSNLLGKKRKHNGYYGTSILNNKMEISRNEVNMANNRGNNCAKCNAELILPGGHSESGFSACLSSRTKQDTSKVKPKCRKIKWNDYCKSIP